MDWLELVFLGSAILGGTLFVLRMIMLFLGGFDFGDSDIPADFHGDIGHGLDISHGLDADMGGDIDGYFDGHMDLDGDMDHPSTDISFKFLSLQGLTAFFMMFGIVGLAIFRSGLWTIFSLIGGALAGMFTVWVIGILFALMSRLQSDGTINLRNAIGQQGSVYLTIPENGSGQVQVVVQGSLKVFDAVSTNQEKIPTGEKIKVIKVMDNKTLVVDKL